MTNAWARRNFLSKVRINRVTSIDEEEIKAGVRRAYQTLLMENGDWRLHLGGLRFGVLREERSRSLEVPSLEEVFEALCNLSGDKALGLDDFTMAFWHFC